MELDLLRQLIQAAATLCIGVLIGFFYDVLKVVRRRVGSAGATILLDLFFWLVLGIVLFLQAMTLGRGGLRMFMMGANALGAVVYFCLFSAQCCVVLEKILSAIVRFVKLVTSPVVKIWVKSTEMCERGKKGFHKVAKHYIMKANFQRKKRGTTREKAGGSDYERQKGKHYYEASRIGSRHLHLDDLDQPAASNRGSRGRTRKSRASRRHTRAGK